MFARSHLVALLAFSSVALAACDQRLASSGSGGGGGQSHPPSNAPSSTPIANDRESALGFDFVRAGSEWTGHAGVLDRTLTIRSTDSGVRLTHAATSSGAFDLSLETRRIGREGDSTPVPAVKQRRSDSQTLILEREAGVTESFVAGPEGVEQTYRIEERPAGEGSLQIDVAFEGLTPALDSSRRIVLEDSAGEARATYRDLSVVDARGVALEAEMIVVGDRVRLSIDDQGAEYPLSIDPVFGTLETTLVPNDPANSQLFGEPLGASGSTFIVGAAQHSGGGAAYVYIVNSLGVWSQQQRLVSPSGSASQFGGAVAVSGTVAVVGDPGSNAAYVFTRSAGVWTNQATLNPSDGVAGDRFGSAISIDGTTVVIGAPSATVGGNAKQGTAYVFTGSGSTWTQQQKLTAADGGFFNFFGWSVSVVSNEVAIGSPYFTQPSEGAVYFFSRSGTTWSAHQEIASPSGNSAAQFGYSVAMSGTHALAGAPGDGATGAAYFFELVGSSWTLKGGFGATIGGTSIGNAVAVNGSSAVIGGNGNAGLFTLESGTWTQRTKIPGSTDDHFGEAVAVGTLHALVGAPQATSGGFKSGLADAYSLGSANGGSCGTGSECVSGFCVDDVCCDQACGGGVSKDCQACSKATGAAVDGTCASLDKTSCEDGDACTSGDTCAVGSCVSGTRETCTPPDSCHSSACDFKGGCILDVTPGVSCTADANPCHAGICSAAGSCDPTNLADGTACSTGMVCSGGTCSADCFIDGVLYQDGDGNSANVCQVCTPSKSATTWSSTDDGSGCNDGNACTTGDHCVGGSCKAGDPVTCKPLDECHDAGTCSVKLGCSNPAKENGAACSIGVCEDGSCGPAPTTASSSVSSSASSSVSASSASSSSASSSSSSSDASSSTDASSSNDASSSASTGEGGASISSTAATSSSSGMASSSSSSGQGGSSTTVGSSSSSSSTGTSGGAGGSSTTGPDTSGGCSCSVAETSDAQTRGLFALAAAGLAWSRRRRTVAVRAKSRA